MKKQRIAIVAHSHIDWISKKDLESYSFLIGVDRGAFVLLEKGIIPDVAIGDFDSVTKEEMKEIQTNVKVIQQHPKDKDQTDLELAVTYALKQNPEEIVLFGVTGGRLDQSLSAIHLLQKIHKQNCRVVMKDEQNMMMLVSGKCHIPKEEQFTYVSILPFTDEISVSIAGCKYPLKKRVMKKGTTLGVSNEIIDDEAEIVIHQGSAYIISSCDAHACC